MRNRLWKRLCSVQRLMQAHAEACSPCASYIASKLGVKIQYRMITAARQSLSCLPHPATPAGVGNGTGPSSGQSPIPGRVFAWGRNVNYLSVPVPADAATQRIVQRITSGRNHVVALTNNGTAQAWGSNSSGQLNIPNELQGSIAAIAAGDMHTLLLLNSGSVICVGGGNDTSVCDVPQVMGVGPTASRNQEPVQRISVHGRVSFAQLANGAWVAWGDDLGFSGIQLQKHAWNAIGNVPFHLKLSSPRLAAPDVQAINGNVSTAAANISAIMPNLDGASFSFLMLDAAAGRLYRRYNPLFVPLEVQEANISRACKWSFRDSPPAWQLAAAVSDEGRVWAWTLDGASMPVPAEVQGRAISVACGHGLVVAVLEGGGVAAWGPMVDVGVLPPLPPADELEAGSGVVAAAAGYTFALLLLGNGTAVPVGAPVGSASSSLPDELEHASLGAGSRATILTLSAGAYSAVAQRQDGSLVAWGDPWEVVVPADVRAAAAMLNGTLQLALGDFNAVALLADGSVVQW
jgi:hypothetical protein